MNVLRVLEAGRLDHAADRGADVVEEVRGFHPSSPNLLDRLRREFGVVMLTKTSA